VAKTVLKESSGGLDEDKVVECLVREVKKESNHEYRLAALRAAGTVILSLELKCFQQIHSIIFPIIKKEEPPEEEDVKEKKDIDEDEEKDEDSSEKLDLRLAVYASLEESWPEEIGEAEPFLLELLETLRRRSEATTKKNMLCDCQMLEKCDHQVQVV
jgi:hypothetical protein